MIVRFLGTGTSTGVPEIGCRCSVCTSSDTRDKRLRSSVWIKESENNLLIDCGPDFREQVLPLKFEAIDALLISHEHYDHVGGIDDLRPYCRFGDINIYAEASVKANLIQRMPYCFADIKYPGVPNIIINTIDTQTFSIRDINITPIRVMHYKLPILGYRINNFAYLTDVKNIPEEEFEKLKDLDVLVMSALRIEEHISHQTLDDAIRNALRIGAKTTYFTHISHQLGLHDVVQKRLPQNMYLAYDGLCIDI